MPSDDVTEETARAAVFGGSTPTDAALRAFDWAGSALGPVSDWSPQLRATLRTFLPSRIPMVLWWGRDLIQIYNDAYAQVVGQNHPRAIGRPARESWASIWDEVGPLIETAWSGEPVLGEDRRFLLARAGFAEETFWTFSYSPVTDDSGEVQGVFVATTERTKEVVNDSRFAILREIGASLSAAEAGSAEAVLEHATDILAGNRGDIPFAMSYLVEPDEERLRLVSSFGLPEGTVERWRTVRGPVPTLPVWEVADDARSRHVPDLGTLVLEQPHAEHMPTEAVVLPVVDHGRGLPLAVIVLGVAPYRPYGDDYALFQELLARRISIAMTDVALYDAARERAVALAALHDAKTRFLENASHELRTPLTLLTAPLQQLLRDESTALPPHHRTSLEIADRAAARLSRLIDALFDVVMAESGELAPSLQPTDVSALTGELAEMFRASVDAAGLEYAVEIDVLPEPIALDPEMWSKVVLNLLSNAVKFTLTGTIGVRLRASEEEVELLVSDSGIGIPPGELDAIFDRFHRVEGAVGRTREGAGIGLALVAQLVEAHGGSVRAESRLGVGSTFTVTLPVRTMPDDTPRAGTRGERSLPDPVPGGRAGPADDTEAVAPTILIVEDNTDMREYLSRLLRSVGHRVHALPDAESCLADLEHCDLILSDVMLPGMSGIDLVRMARSDPAAQRTPIILLTARAEPEAAKEGILAGADDYVTKPFDPDELLARVRTHLDLHQRRESALTAAQHKAATLEDGLRTSRRIGMALGVLMHRYRLSDEDAFDLLRQTSQHSNRKLRDLADDVLRTGALEECSPSQEPPPPRRPS